MSANQRSRVQTHEPSSKPRSPHSSASSRTIACSGVSPGSIPPPGGAQIVLSGQSKRTSKMRSAGSRTSARTARRSGRPVERPASSRNHCSRSAHGTAAFAGDVDGRTKSCVSASRRSRTPSSGRSLNAPRYASLPTNPIQAGVSSRASRSSRAAESAKSPRRRSPEPGVVRYAAFVIPMPSASTSNCSRGSYRREVKPAACSSRQKSLRGFAKCAPAAAETRPGLIPQKTQRRPGASTSGTALSSCRCSSRGGLS
jgi:hypothetical protein